MVDIALWQLALFSPSSPSLLARLASLDLLHRVHLCPGPSRRHAGHAALTIGPVSLCVAAGLSAIEAHRLSQTTQHKAVSPRGTSTVGSSQRPLKGAARPRQRLRASGAGAGPAGRRLSLSSPPTRLLGRPRPRKASLQPELFASPRVERCTRQPTRSRLAHVTSQAHPRRPSWEYAGFLRANGHNK